MNDRRVVKGAGCMKRKDKYICDHQGDGCGACDHAVGHLPIPVNACDETCIDKPGVCFLPWEVVRCVPVGQGR